MSQPRLLLVPEFTELEWAAIRPRLEEWAEVASYDPPGVGAEPRVARLDRRAVAERGLAELDRLGWERYFIATEGWGIPSAVEVALERPDRVLGLALGHAKLSFRRKGERAPVSDAIYSAMTELIRTDHEAFLRHGIAQATGGSVSENLAEQMIERFPQDLMVAGWEAITRDDADIGRMLARLDCPLLLANHVGCLGSTQEGFDDAAAAFPHASVVRVHDAPLSSVEFAVALREFCEGITADVTADSQTDADGVRRSTL
jgi:pimeloyl-ACP methyl ester carboxylesterase